VSASLSLISHQTSSVA